MNYFPALFLFISGFCYAEGFLEHFGSSLIEPLKCMKDAPLLTGTTAAAAGGLGYYLAERYHLNKAGIAASSALLAMGLASCARAEYTYKTVKKGEIVPPFVYTAQTGGIMWSIVGALALAAQACMQNGTAATDAKL